MLRFLIRIGLLLLVGILVYNRFFGTDTEKEQAKEIFRKTGELVGDTWNLLRAEKDKFEAGKYDRVLEQLGRAYQSLREGAKYLDENALRRLDELERRKAKLEQQFSTLETAEQALRDSLLLVTARKRRGRAADEAIVSRQAELESRRDALTRQLEQLVRDSEALTRRAQE
ncbi:MAG: hypothetical protein NZM43_05520 [Saprospiraceae bacterium]|nr:hypothetical protein [Saprospiraceae bacterium]MDW8483767.1 hypothetical protein [Saprospiraceae bacterium]